MKAECHECPRQCILEIKKVHPELFESTPGFCPYKGTKREWKCKPDVTEEWIKADKFFDNSSYESAFNDTSYKLPVWVKADAYGFDTITKCYFKVVKTLNENLAIIQFIGNSDDSNYVGNRAFEYTKEAEQLIWYSIKNS
jgi:hypothetical protein